MPGCFTRSIAERPTIPVLWTHDTRQPIGIGSLKDSPAGLSITGQLDLDTESGRDAYSRVSKKIVSGLSIGYQTVRDAWTDNGTVRQIIEADVFEVSLCVFPMNPAATVSNVKQAGNLTAYERHQVDNFARSCVGKAPLSFEEWKFLQAFKSELKTFFEGFRK